MPPPDSIAGFAPSDWALLFLTAVFLLAAFAWRSSVERAFQSLAARKRTCFVLFFFTPIVLRLLLLPNHPVPVPDIYDEFSHLLVADTLLHGRLANPAHRLPQFFETFFVLQQPTYSSIYPLGLGFVLAVGQFLTGIPWLGILLLSGVFCACCHWMLRGFLTDGWALLGGIFAVIEFGPLCQWTNSYWGGTLAATAGCLVFGALPRLHQKPRTRDAILLGVGFGIHMLCRQFESVFLLISIALYFAMNKNFKKLFRYGRIAALAVVPFGILILMQNAAVTGRLLTLPEQLSQYQYGVPASLTFEQTPTPHVPLTQQQELDYKAQTLTHGAGDSLSGFLLRLEYRVRLYRFFFLPPLYIALLAFCFSLRQTTARWVAATLAIFALGTNLFPYLLVHYLAALTCLFLLVSISGLRMLSRITIRNTPVGTEITFVLTVLCVTQFAGWYALHLFESPALYSILQFETWDSINHQNPARRIEVARRLKEINGPLLVFVHYGPRHIYQNEWVWNKADIDASRIVFARDLGADEDRKLIDYYPNRKVLLLDPDASIPQLSTYQ